MDFNDVHVLQRWLADGSSTDTSTQTQTLTAHLTSTVTIARSTVRSTATATATPTPTDTATATSTTAPTSTTTPTSTTAPTSTTGVTSTTPTSPSTPATPTNGLPNLNISNGTCYAAPGKPMDSRFIPCGNAAAEIQTCCWEGDTCLSDRACFGVHDNGYNTYLAGCTDAQWNMSDPGVHSACPSKPAPYDAEPWIGLAFCGSNTTGNNQWIACPQANSPATMLSAGPCACPTITQQRIVAFQDGATLGSYASLPTSAGGSIMWFPPYSPTFAATATEAGGGAAATASSGPSTSTPIPPVSASPKNTSLIIGISVGIGGFVLLALLGALVFFRNVKRRRRRAAAQFGETGDSDGMPGGLGGGHRDRKSAIGDEKMMGTPASPATQPSFAVSELEIRPARPWSLRSELDGGTAIAPAANNLATRNSIGTLLSSPPTSPTPGGDLYESSTVSSLHGQLAGQTTGQTTVGSGNRNNQHPGAPNFETLVELEG